MSAILVRLTPQTIPATWPRIQTAVENASRRSHGRYTAPLIYAYARDGKWQIWIAVDAEGICAICGTEIVTYDTGLKEFAFRFCTGRQRQNWQHLVADILAWAKDQGCTLSAGSFRRGWKKVLTGWTHTHDSLERVL